MAVGYRWVVVNKPTGMLAHSVGDDVEDVVNWLKHQLSNNSQLKDECHYDPQYDLHPIHRLDREVSGLMLLALDKKVANHLHQQFEKREIEKAYYAVVEYQNKDGEEQGEWKWKLTKKAEGRSKPAGFAKYRVPCTTEFQVIEKKSVHALLKLIPHTGRKHQLRRHCALAGMPIVGDARYGQEHDDGLQLMSCLLSFSDPTTNEKVKVEIKPELMELSH